MSSEEDYVCTLTEASLEKAKNELSEDPVNRMGAVETLRTWVEQQPHFRCKTDTEFLLRFLRHGKFSQLEARDRLDAYLSGVTKYADLLMDIDITQKGILDVVKMGYLIPIGRDSEGRRVVLVRTAHFDPKTTNKRSFFGAKYGVMQLLMRDENTNVNGFVFLVDMTGTELKHKLFWTLEDIKMQVHLLQSCVPARVKSLHYYNLGAVGETILQVFMTFMKKKLKDRVTLHGNNLESVYKVLPMEILPQEYLPDEYRGKKAGSVQNIIDKLVEDVLKAENVAYIRDITAEANASVDESKRPGLKERSGSFRKLNVE